MRILSIRHPGGGHSGVLAARAGVAGHRLDEWTPAAEDAPPEPPETYDGLVVLGGGMNVVGALPRRFTAYQWHSSVFEIPFGAVELARNEVCPQAFRLGDCAWGVQFHPEVTEEILAGWFAAYEVDPDAVAMAFDPRVATAELADRLPHWNLLGAILFDAFMAAVAARAARAA